MDIAPLRAVCKVMRDLVFRQASSLTHRPSFHLDALPDDMISKCHLLRRIDFSDTHVCDLDPLADSQLWSIKADKTIVSDLGPLASLSSLQELSLNGATLVVDLAPISRLTKLRILDIGSTSVIDLRHLADLSELESLDISRLHIGDHKSRPNGLDMMYRDPHRFATGNFSLSPQQRDDAPPALGPLSRLERLRVLIARSTSIADLGPLAQMTALERLDLRGTDLDDIGPLARITALRDLDVSGTLVADAGPLRGLTELRRLNISRTPIVDVGPLEHLVSLVFLDVSETKVADVRRLPCTLETLSCMWTQVSLFPPLPALMDLDCSCSEVLLSTVAALTSLTSLQFRNRGYHCKYLSMITTLKDLKVLDCSFGGARDLSPLLSLSKLETLLLNASSFLGPGVTLDISFLSGLPALSSLSIDNCHIDRLPKLSALTSLSCNGSFFKVEESLSLLTTLRSLKFCCGRFIGLTTFSTLVNLTSLDVSKNNSVGRLHPLIGMTALRHLNFNSTKVSDLSPLLSLTTLVEIDSRWTPATDPMMDRAAASVIMRV